MLACLVWVWVHIQFLVQTSLRLTVFFQWMWTYFTGRRGSRLIVNHGLVTAETTRLRQILDTFIAIRHFRTIRLPLSCD